MEPGIGFGHARTAASGEAAPLSAVSANCPRTLSPMPCFLQAS